MEIVIGKLNDPLTVLHDIDYDIMSITIVNAVSGRSQKDTFTFDLLTGDKVERDILKHCVHTITFTAKNGYNNKHPSMLLKKYLSTNYLKNNCYKFTELTMLNNTQYYEISHKYYDCNKNIEYSMSRYSTYLDQYHQKTSHDSYNAYIIVDDLNKHDLEDLERALGVLGVGNKFFADMATAVRHKRKG